MKTLAVIWLIMIALLIGGCHATAKVNIPFDQVLASEVALVGGVYPELADRSKPVLIFKDVNSYLLFTDGNQTWITLYKGMDTETVKVPYKSFTIVVQMRNKNNPRID